MVNIVMMVHMVATIMMTGLIWFVQIIHYPLFAKVGRTNFAQYEKLHTIRTGWLVAPLMLIELASAILLFWTMPGDIIFVAVNMVLLVLIWMSTFFLQVPQHRVLSSGFDPAAYQRLVRSNWVRTLLWSIRTVIMVSLLLG